MGIYYEYENKNAMSPSHYYKEKDSTEIFREKIKMYSQIAWHNVKGKKEVLDLYPYLHTSVDKHGNLIEISTIPTPEKQGLTVSEEENISLAIIEICIYLNDATVGGNISLGPDNLKCLAISCGELVNRLHEIGRDREAFAAGYFAKEEVNKQNDLSSGVSDYMEERTGRDNEMKLEIESVINELKCDGVANVGATRVFAELKKRAISENTDSCCKYLENCPDTGEETIVFFNSQGRKKNLTKKALKGRLDRLRNKKQR